MTLIPIRPGFVKKHFATYSRYIHDLVCRAASGDRFAASGKWTAFPMATDDVVLWKEYFAIFINFYDSDKGDLAISPPDKLDDLIQKEQAFLLTKGLTAKSPFVKRVYGFFEAYAPYSLFKGGSVWRLEKNRAGEWERHYHRNPQQWNASEFVHSLGVLICPYCNATELALRDVAKPSGTKRMNADLDHVFNKDLYPYLSLSLYNLVPACDTCNRRIKEQRTLSFRKHAHPYVDDVNKHTVFTVPGRYLLDASVRGLASPTVNIRINKRSPAADPRAMALMNFFDIQGACRTMGYSSAVERVVNPFAHGREYLKSTFAAVGISQKDALESTFGFCMDPREINRAAYGKLILDVYEQCKRASSWSA